MDCETFRRTCDAEPGCRETAFLEHATSCAACGRYLDRVRQTDALIERALRIRVPPSGAVHARRRFGATWPRAALAAAASVILVIGITAGTWWIRGAGADRALAAAVIEHIVEEPEALAGGNAVAAAAVTETLATHDIRLVADIGPIVYVRSCVFRGHVIPHLVVLTDAGLVTVLVLPEEHAAKPIEIVDNGMSGRVIPVLGRALAIVGQTGVSRLAQERIVAAIDWGSAPGSMSY